MVVEWKRIALSAVLVASFACLASCKDDTTGGGDVACDDNFDCPDGSCVDGRCTIDDGDGVDGDTDIDAGDTDSDSEDDGGGDADTEVGEEVIEVPCEAETGRPFECACEDDAECASQSCFQTVNGGVCSKICSGDADCGSSGDYQCIVPQDSGSDITKLCVPILAELCRPCAGQDQCSNAATCFDFVDVNSQNCLITCDDASDCPDDFRCDSIGSGDETFCYPELNTCSGCYDPDNDGAGDGPDCTDLDCNNDDASIFFGAIEVCDGKDNDCDNPDDGMDSGVDEDFRDPETGIYNRAMFCGSCENNCNTKLNVIQGECSPTGQCDAVIACEEGFYDIDGDGSNGCEYECTPKADVTGDSICDGIDDDCDGQIDEDVQFQTDNSNCGLCGRVCATAGPGQGTNVICSAGECVYESCNAPYEDCDTDAATLCEANLETVQNCGECGIQCADNNILTSVCEENEAGNFGCAFECKPNFEDCDGLGGNGCEAPLRNDPLNCGGCGITCTYDNGVGVCDNGTCKLPPTNCDPGFADCNGDGAQAPAASDGCEADLTSVETCGSCDVFCSDAGTRDDPECDAEVTIETNGTWSIDAMCVLECSFVPGIGGTQDCDGDPTNGCEVDSLSDFQNCGACGTSCEIPNVEGICFRGACRYSDCTDGYGDCNESVDFARDTPAGLPNDGCEVPTTNDAENCGGCGNLESQFDCDSSDPGGDYRCEVDICLANSCGDPGADCDNNGTCESNLTTAATCGSCGTNCANPSNASGTGYVSAASCNGSRLCVIDTCDGGYGNCDGQWTNGCEVNFAADATCGSACGATVNCNSAFANATGACAGGGSCMMGACDPGYFDLRNGSSDGCECEFTDANDLPGDGIDSNCDGIDGVDDASTYVAKWGADDAECGSQESPCLSVQQGINRAGDGAPVLVSGGVYNESITLRNGISVYGGYLSSPDGTWSSNLSAEVKINSTTSDSTGNITVRANGISTRTELRYLTITNSGTNRAGASSYGVHCTGCTGLRIIDTVVTAGDAGNGAAGQTGNGGSNGSRGNNGGNGSCDGGNGGGGGGAGSACSGNGGRGGNGGSEGSNSGGSGARGAGVGSDGNGGGGGGASSCTSVGAGGRGQDGGVGNTGSSGDGGSSSNVVSSYFQAEGGNNGGSGTVGRGGGGGGGGGGQGGTFCDNGGGNGGGGGGSAGCGGSGGTGGGGGGGSFGIFAVSSTGLTIIRTTVAAGSGGSGGRGGAGGEGGSGGAGGNGATNCQSEIGVGGNGGSGGLGGIGGQGGGGRGGDSAAIARVSTTLSGASTGNDLSFGSAGSGGSPAGGDGQAAGELTY